MKSPMKPVRSEGKLNLFFVEMIIVLLFFGIASAVILRSFAGSDRMARESRETENMAFLAQSAAEIYSGTASIDETSELLLSENKYMRRYSSGALRTVLITDTDVFMTMEEASEEYGGGTVKTLMISFSDEDGRTLYEMETGAYVPERTAIGIE